jgi:hypothetical protein
MKKTKQISLNLDFNSRTCNQECEGLHLEFGMDDSYPCQYYCCVYREYLDGALHILRCDQCLEENFDE